MSSVTSAFNREKNKHLLDSHTARRWPNVLASISTQGDDGEGPWLCLWCFWNGPWSSLRPTGGRRGGWTVRTTRVLPAGWLGAVTSNVLLDLSLELAGDAGPLGGFAKSVSALAAWSQFFPPRPWTPTARSLKSCRGGPRTPGLPDACAALRLSNGVGTELRGSVVLPRRTES